MVVGVIYIVTGWTSAKKLASLKKEISEEQIEIAFSKVAVNGQLTTDQFWDLVVLLGIDMKRPVRDISAFDASFRWLTTPHRKLNPLSSKLIRTTAMLSRSTKSRRGTLEEE
jgi:hypothetical protein